MREVLIKYKFLIIVSILLVLVQILYPQIGRASLSFTGKNFINFLSILIPIFVCMGLLDVWIERETFIRIMGEKSGVEGTLVAFLLGMVTAVPLYASLPVAGMLLKKGSKLFNVLVFLCSCTSIRIPLLLFFASFLGWRYTLACFVLNIFVIIIIAYTIERILNKNDKQLIYDNASQF